MSAEGVTPAGNPFAGLVLAAGAGRRMGRPKALVHGSGGDSWLVRAVGVVRDAGADPVRVVLGAEADEARELVPAGTQVTVAAQWERGLGASLAAGLTALAAADERRRVGGVLVMLVDLPDTTVEVARRVVEDPWDPSTLRRAVFGGRPGHPVLLGRDHWWALRDSLEGDSGAAGYLRTHGSEAVECGDLASGRDQDTPA